MLGLAEGSLTQVQGGKAGWGCGGRGARLGTRARWPTRQGEVVGGGGLSKFRELFHLRLYNPAVPPTERGSRAGPTTPQLRAAARPRRPATLAGAFAFFFFLSHACFPDTFFFFFFFRIGGKKSECEPPPAVERARPPRGSRLQLFLSRPNSARLKLRLCWNPNLSAARLHSNKGAKAPGSCLQRGAHVLEAQACPKACSQRLGPVGKGEPSVPAAPRERAERSRAPGQGGRDLPRPERCEQGL